MNMEKKRPLIFITNDDGVEAPGLHALMSVALELGDVVVVAPSEQHSGQSSALSFNSALRCQEVKLYSTGETPVYSVTGTPVDCVKLGMHAVVGDRRPDLIVAGINHGSNSAVNIIYSGTMGAVLEGCILGIPSIGFSLLSHSPGADFGPGLPFVRHIMRRVLDKGLPEGVCLNVNIPADCEPLGIKLTRAARGYWTEEYVDYVDPWGQPFYMLTGHFHNSEPDRDDTDEYWLSRGWVSVVPARPDQTAHDVLPLVEKTLND